jgi:D-sedoheptulose 7-phosphate isomerase
MTHQRLQELMGRYPALEGCKGEIWEVYERLAECFRGGGKLLICGNGGSAADADHMSTELLKGFCSKRPLSEKWRELLGEDIASNLQNGFPAIPLANFTALMTAFANDCNPDYVFAQLTWAIGKPGDVLFCISTSGNAKNVCLAAKVARAKCLSVIGLSGITGGNLKDLTDVCICVPESETYKVQELHLPIYHTLCLMLEGDM